MNRNNRRLHSRGAVVYVSVSVLLILLLSIFGASVFMKVMRIDVEGASMYTAEEIIEASGITSKNNLLFIDASAASNRISDAMPYISEAKVSRLPPNAIRITVTESSATAMIRYQDSILVIDSSGRVLQLVEEAPRGLLEVRGFSPVEPEEGKLLKAQLGGETQLRYLTEVLAAIEKSSIYNDVSYLDVASITNITLGYTDRFRVILGGAGNALYKLNQLPQIVDIINNDNPDDGNRFIDLSDSNGEWRSAPDM